jgi:cytidylate kinase
LKIFLDADTETRLERIRKRNGADALEIFKTKWIPLENRYFDTFDIMNKCDIVIK